MVLRAKPRVLVIDDDEVARESAEVLLTRWGYTVMLAVSGEEGLQYIKADPPDLVLVDLAMPGISGQEVLAAVQEYDPAIICIMVTGHATLQAAIDAMKNGAYDFLPKPFSPDELRRAVVRGFEHRFLEMEAKELREEKARMEANFVTMVTHQMRSPLSSVRQLMEVMVNESLGPLDQAYSEIIGRAVARLDDLLGTINAWLAMSRIAESGVAERMEPVTLGYLVDTLAQRTKLDADAAGQSVVVEDFESEHVLQVDAESLLEALYNITSNAVKYNRPGGEVRIACRVTPGWVDMAISDQGPGIPEAELDYIFDDFFRSKSPELKSKPGTGLGLSIARRVARAHGGEIQVKSRPGEGATFVVSIPSG